jgi:hypothetical protein
MRRWMGGTRFFRALARVYLVACALTGLAFPAVASSQSGAVDGLLTDRTTGTPVAGAAVYLLDDSGSTVSSALTAADGRFVLRIGSAGVHTFRFERIGVRSEEIAGVHVDPEQSHPLRLSVSTDPVKLPPLVVEADRVCEDVSLLDDRLLTVWTEARKALAFARLESE